MSARVASESEWGSKARGDTKDTGLTSRLMMIATLLLALAGPAAAEDNPHFDPDGPYRQGEDFGTPVSWKTIGDWIDRMPDYEGRITMVISGELTASH